MPKRRGPQPARCVELTDEMRAALEAIARCTSRPHREVIRARIILQLAADPCVSLAAKLTGVAAKTVRKWRDRFLDEDDLKGLNDLPRSGRPATIEAVTRCEVISMACAKPEKYDVPFRDRWTIDSLHACFCAVHGVDISRTSVLRILNKGAIRPHRVKMWLHSPDPLFREKVTDICSLYLSPPEGSTVLCIDEKTGMQALGRKHPNRQAAPGRTARIDYEYVRNGTRSLIAAFEPHTGQVYGEVRSSRKADDLVEFMEGVAGHYQGPVHVVWDNLNIHHNGPSERWTKFNDRHENRFYFHYTPIHASWVNQVELLFGILQSRILRYGVFNSVEELEDRVIGFLNHWNDHEAHPFRWTFKGYPLQIGERAA